MASAGPVAIFVFLAALGALANAGTELAKGGKIEDVIGKNLTPFIGAAVARGFGNAGTAVFAASTGTVINPQIELIYTIWYII